MHASSLSIVSTGGKPSTLSISTAKTLSSSSSSSSSSSTIRQPCRKQSTSTSSSSTVLLPCRKRSKHSFRVTFTVIQPLRPIQHTRATALSLSNCNKYLDRAVDHWAEMDSGATGLFTDDEYRCDDHQETHNGIEVEVADQRTISLTSMDVVRFTNLLPIETRTCNKFKDLSNSLIGVGVICDAGNRVTEIPSCMVFVIYIPVFIWSPSRVARYQDWNRLLQFQGCRRLLHLQGCSDFQGCCRLLHLQVLRRTLTTIRSDKKAVD